MTDRLLKASVFVVLGLGVSSCGGSSHSATTSSSVTATRTTATTTKAPAPRPRTTTAATVSTAPAPAPVSTPPAPDGLRQTTGYATYELCAGRCSGAVPGALRRALQLPHGSSGSCPASAGGGPVSAQPSATIALGSFIGSSWQGARVTWTASSGYHGPVLIRGRQLGGTGAVGFGEGHVPYDELQLLDSGQGSTPSGGERQWLTFTRARSPGCYAYQVDGTGFSEVIVFRAK